MPRGRPKKNNQSQEAQVQTTDQQVVNENYMQQFAKAMVTAFNSPIFNPIWQNEILKSINMTPNSKLDRDKVKELLANPKDNEKALKDLSQFLFGFIMQYKQVVTYLSRILSFDYYLEPTNADKEDMTTKAFKKSYKKALDWLEMFDVKNELSRVLLGMVLEDVRFCYVRESENGIRLQEMPADFCLIHNRNDLGFQYAFNMLYFLRPGINIDDYAPEFKEYYNQFLNVKQNGYKNAPDNVKIEQKQGRYYYWQYLDPTKAFVFKLDDEHAGINPPLSGLFLDAIEIVNYKELLKTKVNLDITKLIINKIPLHKDGTTKTNTKNNFAIDAEVAGMFTQIMQSVVPQGYKIMTSPLETEAIDFAQAENKNSIVGLGNQEFWDSSGLTAPLFGERNLTGTSLQASIKVDEMFVKNAYGQFERFVNFQLKQATGRYRFRIHFEGTEFDRSERFERAIKAAQYGAPVTYVASSMGKTQQEFINLIDFEESLQIKERMTPLLSSHTMSNDQGGRPEKKDGELSVDGERQKEDGTNADRNVKF